MENIETEKPGTNIGPVPGTNTNPVGPVNAHHAASPVNAVPATIAEGTKSGNDLLTYVLGAILISIVGALIFGVGLPFMSLASATSVAANSIIATDVSGSTAGLQGGAAASGYQEINMTVDNGWLPGSFVVKTGVPVRWNVYVKQYGGCINGLLSSDLGINYRFQQTGITKTFEFTPTKAGTIYFTCLMGMATGRIEVRDDVTVSGAAVTNAAAATNPAKKTGGCGCGGGSGSCGQ